MSEQTQTGRRAAFGFIFATALMDMLSLGIMIPVLPNLIKQFAGGDTAAASEWNVLFATTWGLMQFFCSPVLGMLSDRLGRRPVILISVFGLGIDYLFMAFAPTLMWLYVGRIINGMTAASFSTASAYVADVTPPEGRAKAFGLMGSAFGIGFVVGPVLGGWLGSYDLRLPFMVCAALALCNWLYGFFVLPESLPPEKRAKAFVWKKANPFGSLVLLRSHRDLLGLAGVNSLYLIAHNVLPAIFVLYTGHRYGWTPLQMGLNMMVTGILNIIVQAVLVGPVVKRIGERGALLTGLFCGALGFAVFAAAPTSLFYWMGMPIFALMGLVQPGMQGLMTRRVAPHEQGQLQGANSAAIGLAAIFGPLIFGLTFAWSIRHEEVLHAPGLAVALASAFMVAAFLLALRVARPYVAEQPARAAA
jgi:DHA1 family tetracycline resistance protein-like MFS transporter